MVVAPVFVTSCSAKAGECHLPVMNITRPVANIQFLNLGMSPDKRHGSAVDGSTNLADVENPYSSYFIELYMPGYSGNLAVDL